MPLFQWNWRSFSLNYVEIYGNNRRKRLNVFFRKYLSHGPSRKISQTKQDTAQAVPYTHRYFIYIFVYLYIYLVSYPYPYPHVLARYPGYLGGCPPGSHCPSISFLLFFFFLVFFFATFLFTVSFLCFFPMLYFFLIIFLFVIVVAVCLGCGEVLLQRILFFMVKKKNN